MKPAFAMQPVRYLSAQLPVAAPVVRRSRWTTATGRTALTAALFVASTAVIAGDRNCSGRIGAERIDDNVKVVRGATCVLDGTRVDGNVIVQRGATLRANGVNVDGNIQAEGANRVAVAGGSRVDGNIQVKRSGLVRVERTNVDGDIQLFDNRGDVFVLSNRVDGNLQCKGNARRPQGGQNRVKGNREDQCEGL